MLACSFMHEFSFKPLFELCFLESEASCVGELAEDAETIFAVESMSRTRKLRDWPNEDNPFFVLCENLCKLTSPQFLY